MTDLGGARLQGYNNTTVGTWILKRKCYC